MILSGLSVSEGIVFGKIHIIKLFVPTIEKKQIKATEIKRSIFNFHAAKETAQKELEAIHEKASGDEADVILAQEVILLDPDIEEKNK